MGPVASPHQPLSTEVFDKLARRLMHKARAVNRTPVGARDLDPHPAGSAITEQSLEAGIVIAFLRIGASEMIDDHGYAGFQQLLEHRCQVLRIPAPFDVPTQL